MRTIGLPRWRPWWKNTRLANTHHLTSTGFGAPVFCKEISPVASDTRRDRAPWYEQSGCGFSHVL